MSQKTVVIGVCGGIAAYKACELCSKLVKSGINVFVTMTKSATEFVRPLTFASLTHNPVVTDLFEESGDIKHIELAQKADLFCIVPATANVIAKLASGIADDFLTTCALATLAPILIAPAMNTNMLNNPATQSNIEMLKSRGYSFVDSVAGMLACGIVGNGKLAKVDAIFEKIGQLLDTKKDYKGKTVLVTAGATSEPIDPVRTITNRSSGKMGISIADEAKSRGANVILIKGKTTVTVDQRLYNTITVSTTEQMFDAVKGQAANADYIIMAAAPSDYRVANFSDKKIKADKLSLQLQKNPDIAEWVGKHKKGKLVIFAAETNDLIKNAKQKIVKKNADMAVANDITLEGAGFDADTNVVTIIDRAGKAESLPIKSKREIAKDILDRLIVLK